MSSRLSPLALIVLCSFGRAIENERDSQAFLSSSCPLTRTIFLSMEFSLGFPWGKLTRMLDSVAVGVDFRARERYSVAGSVSTAANASPHARPERIDSASPRRHRHRRYLHRLRVG